MLVGNLKVLIDMNAFTVSVPVTETRDVLRERLQNVRKTVSSLCNRVMNNIKNGKERLKYIVEKEAEKVIW